MTLTAEQRSEINRKNAQKSTGPTSHEGKARSRLNALKHGLRADALALPNEDPEDVRDRADAWNDFYRPTSPAAQHLVNQCVRATLLADRVSRYEHAALSKQIRDSEANWDHRKEDELTRLVALLNTEPAEAVRQLVRTAYGCRYLIERWEGLDEALAARGAWCGSDRDEAIRLQGFSPDPETFKGSPGAFLTRLYNLLSHENPDEPMLLWLFDRSHVPDALVSVYRIDHLPDKDECQRLLKEMVAERLVSLREMEEALQATFDTVDRSEAPDRASILTDAVPARLFLRYHAEARTSFHRAYSELVKTLARDAADESAPAPAASPNEAEAAPAASPNEAEPAPESDAQADEPSQPDRPNRRETRPESAPQVQNDAEGAGPVEPLGEVA